MTASSPLRILLLCHSFNSLSQRLMVALKAQGHEVSVELDISDTVTAETVALFKPDLLLAPFLKRLIPHSVWREHLCLVLHPGLPGDQGPSALDWALLTALQEIRHKPLKVLLLLGGQDFFSNGIHLNCIEAAAYGLGEDGAGSAADASWNNINAMNDVAQALITTTDRLTVAVLRGNAGAGCAFLALAADEVWARQGVLLNPHYRNMGNLYGSEYWTYLLPRRLGQQAAQHLMRQRLPVSAPMALKMGLIDRCFDGTVTTFEAQVLAQAQALASTYNLSERLLRKQEQRARDEAARPLADYRQEELSRMHRNFYGFDPSYHVARYHFVHKLPHAWTPRHLALHRS